MLDFIAYLQAQRHTTDLANSARPHSPLVLEPERRRNAETGRVVRNRIGTALRWTADRLDPTRDCPQMPHRGSIS